MRFFLCACPSATVSEQKTYQKSIPHMCIGLHSLAMDSPGVHWIRLLGIGLPYWILDCPVYWIARLCCLMPCCILN